MRLVLPCAPTESFRALPIPASRARKHLRKQQQCNHAVKDPTLELSPSQAGQELVARTLTEINEKLSGRRFQGNLRDGNLPLAERQINEVLSVYQQSHWHKDLQLSAPLSKQTDLRPLQALHENVQAFFTLCLQQKKLASALSCARLLPPSPPLFTALLKACLDHGDFHAVAQAVEVGNSISSCFAIQCELVPCLACTH